MPDNSLIFIGKITRPHGIRGELCAQYYAESYEYFKNNQVFLKRGKLPAKPCIIQSYREQGNILILKIEGIQSRTEAELYRNYDLVIEENVLTDKDLQALEENEETEITPYLHQIIGCTAFVGTEPIGIIDEISFPAGQEIWFIHKENQEILFPAVSDFIDRYDLENQAVYLNPPAGLLEIYLEEAEKNSKQEKTSPAKNTPKSSHKKNLKNPANSSAKKPLQS
jgi:16S rRNA processing protein RimM